MMLLWFAGACRRGGGEESQTPYVPGSELPEPTGQAAQQETGGEAQAVFAGGCFWCTEAVFEQLKGVKDVVSGYAGGTAATADYRTVTTGTTDHAEVIRITYDPAEISFGQLLRVFFATHDPTQLNRQGPDTGRQYRSAVFYADEQQKQIAAAYIEQLTQSGSFDPPIVTTLEPLDQFHEAEEYHQDYARRNPGNPYIQYNALPKVQKLKQKFPDKLKGE
jgi:peptide-methionine (S)-S-oxide reductase